MVHLSDRRLTTPRPFGIVDPASNKTLIVRTEDAMFTIGYTGNAFTAAMPVDVAIAEAIVGQSIRPGFFVGSDLTKRGPKFLSLWSVKERIAYRLQEEGRRLRNNWYVEVRIAGFHKRRNLAVPFVWDLRVLGTMARHDLHSVCAGRHMWRGAIGSGSPMIERLLASRCRCRVSNFLADRL
jgi:hypothetical protein